MLRPHATSLNCVVLWGLISITAAATEETADENPSGVRRAVILVGLPGDKEHEQRFAAIADVWNSWLTGSLGFSPQHILMLRDREGDAAGTKENIARRVKELPADLESGDTLWVLVLGHADEVGPRAKLHLPGPDISEMEFAELFANARCREQVFWLTHTCSSHFLRPLSREGRVVITATAPDEGQNETEFPGALADVTSKDAKELDRDQDGAVSLAELFVTVSEEVAGRYAADKRVPTEHAQLDDDGDGRGTEAGELSLTAQAADTPRTLRRDGATAANVVLPWKRRQ